MPREGGTPDWTAGPKIVHFDRVEWTTSPTPATAAAALQTGEQDWWEHADLRPAAAAAQATATSRSVHPRSDRAAQMMRPNHLQPPFDNPAIRRALLRAINQTDFMQRDRRRRPEDVRTCRSASSARARRWRAMSGWTPLTGQRDYDKVKRDADGGRLQRREGRADGADRLSRSLKAIGDVAADMMKRCGMNVDYQAVRLGHDAAAAQQADPVDQGGWSVFRHRLGRHSTR